MNTGSASSVRHDWRRRQAREWFVIRLSKRTWSPARQKRFERWAADERNLAEFRGYEQVVHLLRALPRRPLPTDAELHAHFARTASRVSNRLSVSALVSLLGDTLAAPRIRYMASRVAILGVLTAVGFSLVEPLIFPTRPSPARELVYQTAPGHHLVVPLEDHSEVKLGGATRLGVLFSDRSRHITLYEGEALFNVTHDARVPFLVDVAATRVTDLGTTFHVRRYTDEVLVDVAEGAVAVTPREYETEGSAPVSRKVVKTQLRSVTVKAGEEVSSDVTGQISQAHPADFQAVAWWLYGRRVYRDRPLAKVIEDLRLYNSRRIEYDPLLGTVPFTGIVDQSKPEDWVRGLQEILPVEIDDSDPQRLMIRCRHPDCRPLP